MKTATLLSLLGIGTFFGGICLAQVSSFPEPPSLNPPPERTSTPDATNPANTPSTPSGDPFDQSTKSDAGAGSTTSPDESGTKPVPMTAATLTSMEALDDKNVLEPGDTLSFRVIEDKDDAVTRVVTDTGEVDFPYIGRLKVEGKTCHQVAVELKKLLEVDYYKRATVIVGLDLILGEEKTKPRGLVWVVGEVRQEGPEELSKLQPLTVSQAILRAGGFSTFADQRKVRLMHRSGSSSGGAPSTSELVKSKKGQIIDVKSVFEGYSALDPVVEPDDYIIVPKRIVNF